MQCDCDYIIPGLKDFAEHYDNCSSLLKNGEEVKKNPDGSIRLQNPHLNALEVDHLYHLALDTGNHDFVGMFSDVKFVVMGGTEHRMLQFARYLSSVLGVQSEFVNLTEKSHRYAMYKVGPVLSVSHGIGIPSMSVLLQEVFKLLSYSRCDQPILIRLGTSGGLAVEPGSVVVSEFGLNGVMEKSYDLPILGKMHKFPSTFDSRVAREIISLADPGDGFKTYLGGTFAADDYYRGQARLDGPFCRHSESDKMSFLSTLVSHGVKNIEMEATAFAAYTREAGVRSADVCVTLLDRMQGDQITTSKETLLAYQTRPMKVVARYIQKYCERSRGK